VTDADLVAKKLAFIETCVDDLLSFVQVVRAKLPPVA